MTRIRTTSKSQKSIDNINKYNEIKKILLWCLCNCRSLLLVFNKSKHNSLFLIEKKEGKKKINKAERKENREIHSTNVNICSNIIA